ncbi:MAG: hypothetical protein OXC19_17055 [Bryobacterales bacterium]|nr:hypothetical protein [Bryobacterales bacterium]
MAKHTFRHSVYLSERQEAALQKEADRRGLDPGTVIRQCVVRNLVADEQPDLVRLDLPGLDKIKLPRNAVVGVIEVWSPTADKPAPRTVGVTLLVREIGPVALGEVDEACIYDLLEEFGLSAEAVQKALPLRN